MCAGAVGSPQLLMLSGIGPAGPAARAGHRPGGRYARGRREPPGPPRRHGVATRPRSPLPRSRYNHGEMYAALRSPLAGACPDLHLFPILLPVAPGAGYPPPAAGYVLVASAMAPDSRGSVQLASADPQDGPADRPGLPARRTRPGPAGGGTADDPPGRRQRRVLARRTRPRRGPARTSAPAPGCATSSGARSAATTTRPAPAGWARMPDAVVDPNCGSAGSPGCGSPTRR